MKKYIILFGATSYVGGFVIRRLLDEGFAIIAVGRNKTHAAILLYEWIDKIEFCSAEELIEKKNIKSEAIAGIINLAYIQDAPFEKLFARNKQLCDQIHKTALHFGVEKVIHTSTLSAFGYELPNNTPSHKVEMKWGDPYVETKIAAEHRFCCNQRKGGYALAIVRLGNVLGPASPAWTAGIAGKILIGKPVGFTNEVGFSNATYVKNIADYFLFLLEKTKQDWISFGYYHHLAELSENTWNVILEGYSEATGMPLFRVTRFAPLSVGNSSTKRGLVTFAKRFQSGKKSGYARYWSSVFSKWSWIEKVIQKIKKRKAQQFHIASSPAIVIEFSFLNTMCAKNRFYPHTFKDWKPPYEMNMAMSEMKEHLIATSYCYTR